MLIIQLAAILTLLGTSICLLLSSLSVGTKSVLYGAHAFWLHPFFVAAAWTKLYGFPWDPRLWVAFFVHDLGYLGKPNMDGPEGESHPEMGALIMHMFDGWWASCRAKRTRWHDLSLYHSRYYAKAHAAQPSRLCFADKLAFALTPAWLYLPMVMASGEIEEYLNRAQKADSAHWKPTGNDKRIWHRQLCEYMRAWVKEHKDGAVDTWTDANRHAKTESGVWK